MLELALYKGPPSYLLHIISHNLIKLRTLSKYSHAELVIDGICWSSSARDHGVRAKVIDLNSGRWDVFRLTDDPEVKQKALNWFLANEGRPYDYRNIVRYLLPIVGHNKKQYVCFEACGAALGISNPHKLTADTLLEQALQIGKEVTYG